MGRWTSRDALEAYEIENNTHEYLSCRKAKQGLKRKSTKYILAHDHGNKHKHTKNTENKKNVVCVRLGRLDSFALLLRALHAQAKTYTTRFEHTYREFRPLEGRGRNHPPSAQS